MQTGKIIVVIALLGIVGAGCVSAPFVDDSIAKCDADPLSVKLNLKAVGVEPTPPLPADALTGKWWSIYTEYIRCEDGHPANSINNQSAPCVDGWEFGADGRYTKSHSEVYAGIGIAGAATTTISSDEHGQWSYRDGVITLNRERVVSTTKYGDKIISRKDDESRSTRQVDVEWYAGNEIVLKDGESLDSRPQAANGYKTTVRFDKPGIRTIRTIHVTGVRNGRETGEVFEVATSVRFKKNEVKAKR